MARVMLTLACLLAVTYIGVTESADYLDHVAGAMNTSSSLAGSVTPSDRLSCNKNQDLPKNRVNTSEQLRRLRLRMKTSLYSAYIIPLFDEHQSEYVSDYDKRLKFISGFSGSLGTAVVLLEDAALWTDSRYFIQADQEIDCNWSLMKIGEKDTPTISGWLSRKLQPGSKVGVDPKIITEIQWTTWKKVFERNSISLSDNGTNLIDDIWTIGQGRTPESARRVYVLDLKYAGKSWQSKVAELREMLREAEIDGIIIHSLDQVSWLFNLRGGDISYTPVFKAYAFVSQNFLRLYIKPIKLTEEVRKHLKFPGCNESNCVEIKNYNETFDDLHELIKECGKIWLSYHSSHAVVNLVPKHKRELVKGSSPIMNLRAVKNNVEIQGMKNAHLKDAVAITDFASLLTEEINAGNHWDEIKASKMLTKFRLEQELNRGESFETISASGPNAAIVHYIPQRSTNRNIDAKSIYLLDSGGQYLDGTCDITRTFHFGQPSDLEIEAYTRVLMGSINLFSAVFPRGVQDSEVNILAKLPLHDAGMTYLHGTGHGIGSFLGVHEAPILISDPKRTNGDGSILKPGMFMSNEPGYYEMGKFGIRLETTMMVVKANTPHKVNNMEYYTFEPIAFVPFEPKLINFKLLNEKQKTWLNDYNVKVRNSVGVELRRQKRERAFRWLLTKTEHIKVNECSSDAYSIKAYSIVSFLLFKFLAVIIS